MLLCAAIAWAYCAFGSLAHADPSILGRLPLRTFTPLEYDGHSQNWDVSQGPDGVIYIANSSGIQSFDGTNWRQIPVEGLKVFSVAAGENGNIYVGAEGEFGYLAPDHTGEHVFHSLVRLVPPEHRDFGQIRRIVITDEGVFFQHREYLFRWTPDPPAANQEQLSWWFFEDDENLPAYAYATALVNKRLFVARSGDPLRYIDGDHVSELSPDLLPATGMVDMIEWDDGQLLLLSRHQGLYQVGPEGTSAWETPASVFAKREHGSGLMRLPDGNLLLSTSSGGAVVVDANGKLLRRFDKSIGLPDNGVSNRGFIDAQGGLWLPLIYGIARIDISSPLQIFGIDDGLDGGLLDVASYNNRLYVATTKGLFVSAEGQRMISTARFHRPDPSIRQFAWDLEFAGPDLIAATQMGLFAIMPDGQLQKLHNQHTMSLAWSPGTNSLFVGTLRNGLQIYRRTDGNWYRAARIPGTYAEVRAITLLNEEVWLQPPFSNQQDKLQRLRFPDGVLSKPVIESYGVAQGLVSADLQTAVWDGRLVVGSSDGLFEFHPAHNSFEADANLPTTAAGHPQVDANGNLWFQYRDGQVAALNRRGNPYELHFPLQRVQSIRYSALVADDRAMWAGTLDGRLVRRELRAFDNHLNLPANVVLASVSVIEGQTLHRGTQTTHSNQLRLPFAQRALRFNYSLPHHAAQDKVQYQTRMLGLDQRWSGWSTETMREYPLLTEGYYQFQVRARSDALHETPPAVFSLRIVPPWFRSWWAYAIYAIGLLLAISALIQRFKVSELHRQIAQRERNQRNLLVYQKKLRAMAFELSHAEERARRSTAEDLHDGVAQLLAVCKMRLETLRPKIRDPNHKSLNELQDLLNEAIAATRSITLELSPPMLYDLGLAPALGWLGERMQEQYGLTCNILDEGSERILSPQLRVVLYRTIRELLHNVTKHAGVDEVSVTLSETTQHLMISVADKGLGFAPTEVHSPDNEHGFGLFSSRERISLIGGTFNIYSEPNMGTRIEISVPLFPDERRLSALAQPPDSLTSELHAPGHPYYQPRRASG